MTLRFAVLAGILALASLSAPVSAQTYDANLVKDSVTKADLIAIVGSLGHKVREGTNGPFIVAVDAPDGLMYTLQGTACNARACKGIRMYVGYGMPSGVPLEMVNKINIFRHAFTTTFSTGVLTFSRYLILDDGVTMANISKNIEVLLSAAPTLLAIAKGDQAL